jgi:hypothetical protein
MYRKTMQPPAKPVGRKPEKHGKTPAGTQTPAVAQPGRLTLQQIKHAVDTALRGQTFEADAQG